MLSFSFVLRLVENVIPAAWLKLLLYKENVYLISEDPFGLLLENYNWSQYIPNHDILSF